MTASQGCMTCTLLEARTSGQRPLWDDIYRTCSWDVVHSFNTTLPGWLVLVAIRPVLAALDGWTFGWLLAGGVAYTLGTVFYHRPSLRYSHAIWHGFVIAGSVCHYIAVLAQVLPAPR